VCIPSPLLLLSACLAWCSLILGAPPRPRSTPFCLRVPPLFSPSPSLPQHLVRLAGVQAAAAEQSRAGMDPSLECARADATEARAAADRYKGEADEVECHSFAAFIACCTRPGGRGEG